MKEKKQVKQALWGNLWNLSTNHRVSTLRLAFWKSPGHVTKAAIASESGKNWGIGKIITDWESRKWMQYTTVQFSTYEVLSCPETLVIARPNAPFYWAGRSYKACLQPGRSTFSPLSSLLKLRIQARSSNIFNWQEKWNLPHPSPAVQWICMSLAFPPLWDAPNKQVRVRTGQFVLN